MNGCYMLSKVQPPKNTRGLVRGEIFNQQGQLVATAVQEGVMRFKK